MSNSQTSVNSSGQIVLKFRSDLKKDVLKFKISPNDQLRKVMYDYCDTKNVNFRETRFLFDGQPILEYHTPASLSMESGDQIDTFQQQGVSETNNEWINLFVDNDATKSKIHFRILRTQQLRRIMYEYCERINVCLMEVVFNYYGKPILETNTPEFLEMNDGDELEVFPTMDGGYCF